MFDKLVKIERKNWPNLRDLYSSHDTNTFLGYCVVENYIQWFEKDPQNQNVAFYCLNGDWSDGTFVAIVWTTNILLFPFSFQYSHCWTFKIILGSSICVRAQLGPNDWTFVSAVEINRSFEGIDFFTYIREGLSGCFGSPSVAECENWKGFSIPSIPPAPSGRVEIW